MKSLKQIIDSSSLSEGVVMMSDYKLDKRGRKYKAHRHTMGKANPYPTAKEIAAAMRKGPSTDTQESFNPYEEMILSEADNAPKEKKKKQDQQPQPTNTQSDRTKQEPYKAPEREQNVGDKFGEIIMKALKLVGGRDVGEEMQVDEVSKATMANYISKAAKDVGYEANLTGFKAGQKTKGHNPTDETPRETKRHKGIARALKKLTGVKVSEDVEQVDEISKATAQSYMNKRVDPVYGIPKTSSKKPLSSIMKSLNTAQKRVTGRKPTSEELELDESSDYTIVSTHHFPDKSMAVKVKSKESGKEFHHVGSPTHLNNTLKSRYKINYRLVWDKGSVKPAMAKEEVEQVDELKDSTVKSYYHRARSSRRLADYKNWEAQQGAGVGTGSKLKQEVASKKVMDKRDAGMARAKKRVDVNYKPAMTWDQRNAKIDKAIGDEPVEPTVYRSPAAKANSKVERLKAGLADIKKTVYPNVKEEVDQIAEISKGLATRYVQKKVSQMAKKDSLHTDKDVKNLSRAYRRMAEENIQEAAIVKVATNPDGSKTVTVKTDTGKIVNHTYSSSASINKFLKRRYGITGSL